MVELNKTTVGDNSENGAHNMVRLIIDNCEVVVPEHTTILDAAKSVGIQIPTLCYLRDLNEIGGCRVCVVEVEGCDQLVAACNNYVLDGMVVHTNSPKAREARRTNVQLLLSQHDSQCTSCVRSGNCNLQTIANDLGIFYLPYQRHLAGEGWDFSYYPTFNGPQDMGRDLVDLGYDVVSIANNHMLDKGGAGLEATIKFWKSMNVLMIGGYESEDDYNAVRILEKDGVKIAFLSYTYGTNGITLGSGYNVVIPYLGEATVKSQIETARTQADFVFVSAHWGIEDHFTPSDEQKKYARIMADAGADVILGHHPHVIQPVEWISAEDGRKTLCVYSLGNFMAEQAYDYNMIGGMISFDIVTKGDTRSIENPVFIPTVYYFDTSFYGNCIYLLETFTAAQAASHGIAAYGHYTNLETLRKYVTDTVSPEFLPESFK